MYLCSVFNSVETRAESFCNKKDLIRLFKKTQVVMPSLI